MSLTAASVEAAMDRQDAVRRRRHRQHAEAARQTADAQEAEQQRWDALPVAERLRRGIVAHLSAGTAMDGQHPEDAA